MDNALATLFYPIEQNLVDFDVQKCSVAFLNARTHDYLQKFDKSRLFLQQGFKPYVQQLEAAGYDVFAELDGQHKNFECVFILLPKNMDQAQHLVAYGLQHLAANGLVFCAADNKAGGTRLQKMLQKFGVSEVQDASKNKARVAWGVKSDLDAEALEKALTKGCAQEITNDGFISRPGLFSWDRIDKGSELLAQHLPRSLKGTGADFGCGYGFLSRFALENCPDIKKLTCVDADYRAVELCTKNLEALSKEAEIHCIWEDLTQPLPSLKNLDFIVMNPPFHEGKNTDADIGKAFINTAVQNLKPGGMLWIVANAHLPYEEVLEDYFSDVRKVFEGAGFKIFCAAK